MVGQFSCSNYEQKRTPLEDKDFFAAGKNDSPPPPQDLHGPRITQA